MTDTRAQVLGWLQTFSQVDSMKDNPEAVAREIDTIAGVFVREKCWSDVIDRAFQHLKMTSESRAWPTAAHVYTALRAVQRKDTGEVSIGTQGGDRGQLSSFELQALDGVLSTAKRWLRMYPNMRPQAFATLEYWKEPLADDRGKTYEKAVEK